MRPLRSVPGVGPRVRTSRPRRTERAVTAFRDACRVGCTSARRVRRHLTTDRAAAIRVRTRSEVDEPTTIGRLEARIDVPTGVAGVGVAREPHDDESEVRARRPIVGIEELTDRVEQTRSVGRFSERFGVDEPAHHRLVPTRRVGQVDAEFRGGDLAATGGERSGKRRAEMYVSRFGELIELSCVQHERNLDAKRSATGGPYPREPRSTSRR